MLLEIWSFVQAIPWYLWVIGIVLLLSLFAASRDAGML